MLNAQNNKSTVRCV